MRTRIVEIIGYLGVLAVLARCLWGCSQADARTATVQPSISSPQPPDVVRFDPVVLERLGLRTEPAGSSAKAHRLRVSGTLEYDLERYAEVGTVVDGRVTGVTVRAGDRVRKGQTLATLIVPTVAAAQSDAVSAQAGAFAARTQAVREERLLDQSLTTPREAEIARGAATRSDAALAAANARLRALGVATPNGTADIGRAGAIALAAPIDGVVVARDAVIGSFLHPTETAFIIADPTRLWATLEVFETDLDYIEPDAKVEFTVDAIPGRTFSGHIAQVEPRIGAETRTVRARIAVRNDDGALKAGLFARASIELPRGVEASRLLIPAGAVQQIGGANQVFVMRRPGEFEVRRITIERLSSQLVEVRDGLARGEALVIDKAFILRGEVTKL